MSATHTYLIYMREKPTEAGVMPPYTIEVSADEVDLWLADGGVDISDDPAAWEAYGRWVDAYNASLL